MINYTLAIQGLIDPELRAMADRIKFIHSNFKNCLDGIEVGFFAHKYLEFLEVMKSRDVVDIMGKFKFNTLHIAVRKEDPVPESVLVEIVQTANSLWKRGLITAAGFHLNMSSQFDLISGEAVEKGVATMVVNDNKNKSSKSIFLQPSDFIGFIRIVATPFRGASSSLGNSWG